MLATHSNNKEIKQTRTIRHLGKKHDME